MTVNGKLEVFVLATSLHQDLVSRLNRMRELPVVSSISVVLDSSQDNGNPVRDRHKVGGIRVLSAPPIDHRNDRRNGRNGRIAGRIGILRNMVLAESKAAQDGFVLFLDDDIDVPNSTVNESLRLSASIGPSIVGVDLRGHDSRDSLTQLLAYCGVSSVSEPLLAGQRLLNRPDETPYVSGGFLLFSSEIAKHCPPFPHSFNETWLWCLLCRAIKGIPSIQLRYKAEHLRATTLATSFDQFLAEQTGVLVARLLKRTPENRYPDLRSLLKWLCSHSTLELAAVLGARTRLHIAVQSCTAGTDACISRRLTDTIGLTLSETMAALDAVDWQRQLSGWSESYLEVAEPL